MSFVPAALLGLLLGASCLNVAVAAPSLAERRAVAAYQAGAYATQLKEIQAAAGFEVPVEVQWDSLALPGQEANYADEAFWTKIYFNPLSKALGTIATDEMGKTAVKEKLKNVVVRYDAATAPASNYDNGVTFTGGVLTLNFQPYSNADDVDARAQAIQKALEAGL
ncbi:hypothetical protein [Pseudomonas sp.]|uniref:hypothetical protein n=1 Tax=Pseudomonas sp. TaxID=306 RepID=UPI0033921948